METLLAEDTKILTTIIDVLPGGQQSDYHPFTSCVVNLNVTTSCHRDSKDKLLCLVLVIQDKDTHGGELGLLEPGIVLGLRNGDVVVFPSGEITHFNNWLKGVRSSLVFQTDIAFDQWVRDRNGFRGNTNFKGCFAFSYTSEGGGYDSS